MKLNILTPGFKTPNGIAFLFPFIVWKSYLKQSGIEVCFENHLSPELFDCDILCVDSKYFASRWKDFREETEKIFEQFSRNVDSVIYFDTTDSTGMDNTYPLPYVTAWVKNQLLVNKQEYLRPIYSKGRIYGEFAFKKGVALDPEPSWSVPITNEADLGKLRLGWNSGLANYSLLGPISAKLLDRLKLTRLLRFNSNFKNPLSQRDNSFSCRYGVNYIQKSVAWNREEVSRILGLNFNTNKVNRYQYFHELETSKVVISPFGLGEITLKDYEVFITGAMLFKPSMDHMQTWPPFFKKEQTYIDYKWDLTDFKSKLASIINDDKIRTSIAVNAQKNYIKYTISKSAPILFVEHLKQLIKSII